VPEGFLSSSEECWKQAMTQFSNVSHGMWHIRHNYTVVHLVWKENSLQDLFI